MLGQVILVVLASLACCHSYPSAGSPYQPSSSSPQLLPTDDAHAAKIKKLTQAGLPVPPGGQYLFYYPGVPGSPPVVYTVKNEKGDQEEEGGGAGGSNPLEGIYNFFVSWWETTSVKPAEEAVPEKEPPKLTEGEAATTAPASANLETFDEDDKIEPTSASPVDPKEPEQKLFLIGQPQFFGNYDALKNPDILKELGNKNPFPSILSTGNQQPVVFQSKFQPTVYGSPGKAATEFQKLLVAARLKQAEDEEKAVPVAKSKKRRPVVDTDTVVVEALKMLPHAYADEEQQEEEEEGESAEAVEAGQGEPSVAQVRPQAIALAGPSGVAAAAPIGTAVVGRGGLAVAAPSATAVAGPSGGEPPLVVPANRVAQQAFLAAHGHARFLERAVLDDGEDYSYAA